MPPLVPAVHVASVLMCHFFTDRPMANINLSRSNRSKLLLSRTILMSREFQDNFHKCNTHLGAMPTTIDKNELLFFAYYGTLCDIIE